MYSTVPALYWKVGFLPISGLRSNRLDVNFCHSCFQFSNERHEIRFWVTARWYFFKKYRVKGRINSLVISCKPFSDACGSCSQINSAIPLFPNISFLPSRASLQFSVVVRKVSPRPFGLGKRFPDLLHHYPPQRRERVPLLGVSCIRLLVVKRLK